MENDNLKRLLLINHDFTASIEERIREIEQQDQERALQKFRELRERTEQSLHKGLALYDRREAESNDSLRVSSNLGH